MKQLKQTFTRSILINQEEISYNLSYSKKAKYMRMQISRAGGLEIILPRGFDLVDAEKFIQNKSGWIKKHLKHRTSFQDKFSLFGNEIKVIQEFDFFIRNHKIKFEKNELKIVSPQRSRIELKKLYEIWLKHQAKKYLSERAEEIAAVNNFRINKITIRGQKTRWGSCSSKGNLSFNFSLLKYRKEVIDYVIVHELCHLREMNHSKKFWLLVGSICPEYKLLRKELKGFFEA